MKINRMKVCIWWRKKIIRNWASERVPRGGVRGYFYRRLVGLDGGLRVLTAHVEDEQGERGKVVQLLREWGNNEGG